MFFVQLYWDIIDTQYFVIHCDSLIHTYIVKKTKWSWFVSKANHSTSQSSKSMPQCWRNWSWTVLWRPTRSSNIKKRCPFHHRGLECKSRKSRDIWNNKQVWSQSTKWSRAKVNRVLPREHTVHSKHSLLTTQETTLHMDITRWLILKSDWLYYLQPKMESSI